MTYDFGYIFLTTRDGEKTRIRVGTLDVEWVKDQYGPNPEPCHIRLDDGCMSSSCTVRESAGEILRMLNDHDNYFSLMVREFALRNNIILMKGETW